MSLKSLMSLPPKLFPKKEPAPVDRGRLIVQSVTNNGIEATEGQPQLSLPLSPSPLSFLLLSQVPPHRAWAPLSAVQL